MKSLWRMTADMPRFTTLEKDIRTDVLIIGAGITGILTAHFLKQRGIDYTLVEKGRLCELTTGNTTAKVTFQHGLIYHKLLKDAGTEKAQMYLESGKQALESYAELCKSISCDFELKDNFVYSLKSRKKLEDEMNALMKIGYRATLSDNIPLPFETKGAVCFHNQAQLHPLKFLSAISEKLNIYENTFVKSIEGKTAITPKGRIHAQKIIVTTHFPFIDKHGLYFMKLYQHRSYVIALEKGKALQGMYVDEAQNGMSFRNYRSLLLVGGGDHRTGKNGGNWHQLRSFAATHYPEAREKYFWAAQDCMSLDGIPYIGQYSKSTPELLVATGFNKWGMTSAMVAARLLCDMIQGKPNQYTELYKPSRNMLKSQLLINTAESVISLLTPSTKRCPHLGCALKWNRAEHSWDCPCHGSRFTKDGYVLENPANKNTGCD